MVVRKPDGALESEVLRILWASSEPLTPRLVQTSLSSDLAYTSVATILTRLVDKGLVQRHRVGRAFAYSPSISEVDWLSDRLDSVFQQSRNRGELLAGFVGRLSKRELKELRSLLEARKHT